MLRKIYPRGHARISSLQLLGQYVEGFVSWLHAQGYSALPIRLRLRQLPRVEKMLRRRRVARIEDLTAARLLGLAPKDSQDVNVHDHGSGMFTIMAQGPRDTLVV